MAAASMLRKAAGPLRRSGWKLLQEPTHLALLPGSASSLNRAPSSSRFASMRFASTKRKASKDINLPRILKNDISHKVDEEYKPCGKNDFQVSHVHFVEVKGAKDPDFNGLDYEQREEQLRRQYKWIADKHGVIKEELGINLLAVVNTLIEKSKVKKLNP